MKTAQIMRRPFLDGVVRQNHKTKMFRLNDLQNLFPDKALGNWARRQDTRDFIRVVMENENLPFESVVCTNKSNNPEIGGTWVHPLLLLDYAMYVSPEFKYKALTWLQDNLCEFRDYAGEGFKEMNDACKEVLEFKRPWDYAKEAMMVAEVVGVPVGQRNAHSEADLRRLDTVQRMNAALIRRGVRDRLVRKVKLKDTLDLLGESNRLRPQPQPAHLASSSHPI